MTTDNVQLPTITMNGTNAGALLEGYCTALSACRAAREAIAQVTPHMRDYCQGTAGPDDYRTARDQHVARLQAIENIETELTAIGMHCADEHIRRGVA